MKFKIKSPVIHRQLNLMSGLKKPTFFTQATTFGSTSLHSYQQRNLPQIQMKYSIMLKFYLYIISNLNDFISQTLILITFKTTIHYYPYIP